eukprot:2965961-Pleurochrysis_carterae.AAC.1
MLGLVGGRTRCYPRPRHGAPCRPLGPPSAPSVTLSVKMAPIRGGGGWVELFACPLARRRRHRANVRARAARASEA